MTDLNLKNLTTTWKIVILEEENRGEKKRGSEKATQEKEGDGGFKYSRFLFTFISFSGKL